MKLHLAEPDPAGSERAREAKAFRDLATEIARLTPQALSRANSEENDHGPQYPANFTKGLAHDNNGLLFTSATTALPDGGDAVQLPAPGATSDYACFVEAINSRDRTLFEKNVPTAEMRGVPFANTLNEPRADGSVTFSWRGWESPRAGHVYELQGPDAGAVGMAPAPRVGSSELAFEMAEVYALAILRDVPFSRIEAGGDTRLLQDTSGNPIVEDSSGTPIGNSAELSAQDLADYLSKMTFINDRINVRSSTPHTRDKVTGLNRFEQNRRAARLQTRTNIAPETLFRGSTKGAFEGPYISQFMLMGTTSRAGAAADMTSMVGAAEVLTPPTPGAAENVAPFTAMAGMPPADPGTATFDMAQGLIQYGVLTINQRVQTHKNGLDYMTDWASWLDVQNGANFKGTDRFETKRRFITTPRDLATYVHFDELYEAYLNACLLLLGMGVPTARGFPEPSPSGRRDAFATFGGPHVLSLVTEVATRCLKAVRRQKFNYHRRARPETLGGRLTLLRWGMKACLATDAPTLRALGINNQADIDRFTDGAALSGAEFLEVSAAGGFLGKSTEAFKRTLDELAPNNGIDLLQAVIDHNTRQNDLADERAFAAASPRLPKGVGPAKAKNHNLLLPMAFPEGSPMHPAYGAGHATVAGGCVTMLKAFFDMFNDADSFEERELRVNNEGKLDPAGTPVVFVPDPDDGLSLFNRHEDAIQGADPKPGLQQYTKALTIQGELDKLAANISIGRNMAGVHYYSDYFDSLRMGERIAVGIMLEQMPAYGDAVESRFKSFDGDLLTLSGEAGSCPSLSITDQHGAAVTAEDWWLRHVSGREISEDLYLRP